MSDAKTAAKDAEALLGAWEEKLRVAETNMREMRMLGAYKLFTGNPRPNFTGRTANELVPAMAALEELWLNFSLLSENLRQARTIFDSLPSSASAQAPRLAEIKELLSGASIQLPTIQTPLEQRGLTTPAEIKQAITPERLLEILLKAFETAVKVIAPVDRILESHYQVMAETQQRIDGLAERITASGGNPTLLAQLNKDVAKASADLDKDPLGSEEAFSRTIPALLAQAEAQVAAEEAAAAARKAEEDALRSRLGASLTWAQAELQALVALERAVDVKRDETIDRIAAPAHLPRNPELLKRLEPQLQKLSANFSKGLLNPVDVGLGNWKLIAAQFRSLEEAALKQYTDQLDERMEIRGIFETAQVRAAKYGLVEHEQLVELAKQAKSLLWRPTLTPLAEARQVVEQYRGVLAPLISEKKAQKA